MFNPLEHEINSEDPVSNSLRVATTSQRRLHAMQQCFPGKYIEPFNIKEDELEDSDPLTVAHWKVEKAKLSEPDNNILFEGVSSNLFQQYAPIKSFDIIAADTRTIVPTLDRGSFVEDPKGKPSSVVEPFETFLGWQEIGRLKSRHVPYYVVRAGTEGYVGGNHITDEKKVKIVLLPEKAKWLATKEGYDQYLQEFFLFYETKLYERINSNTMAPTDISAGLSLPVFVHMNAIQSINGVEREQAQFARVLMESIYYVAIGISPKIIDTIQKGASNKLWQWSWLREVTETSLRP